VDLAVYLQIVQKRWWWMLLGVTLGALVAFGICHQMTPMYEASVSIMVGAVNRDPSPMTSDINVSQDLALTYGELLQTRKLQSAAMADLGYEGLPNVTVTVQRDTQFVTVTVRDAVPQRAVDIANALIRQLQLQLPDDAPLAFAENQLAALRTDIEATQNAIASERDPGSLAELSSRLSGLRTQYSELYSTYVENKASVNTIVVVDPPELPSKPVVPKTGQTVLLASILGLMVAVGVAVGAEYLHSAIEKPQDVEALNLPYLGSVGMLPIPTDGNRRERLCLDRPQSSHAEAYRFASVVLQYSIPADGRHAVLVSSPNEGEGKTTMANALAIVMAQAGKQVVLVDADLRRSSLHTIWSLPNEVGLSSLLTGHVRDVSDAIQLTPLPGLKVITSGPPTGNPAALLSTDVFKEVIAALCELADMVIVDSPPLLPVVDASAMARALGGVVLVARSHRTTAPACAAAADLVAKSEGRLLGVFLNAVKPQHHSYYGYYGYGYGHYPYGDDKDERDNGDKPAGRRRHLPRRFEHVLSHLERSADKPVTTL